ncbi:MAG: hypothetical protein ABI689_09370 [Thermoanaerobaculia bacterium]
MTTITPNAALERQGAGAGGVRSWAGVRLTLPSNEECSIPQPTQMLRQVATVLGRLVTAEEWESL